jgi:tRNA(His) 5'-end guanylyltransferase
MTLKDKCRFYQTRRDYLINVDNYVLVHIDGRSFSKMVKNKFVKPFDNYFINMMNETAKYLCEKVQGVQLAYVQSDEISLLIKKNNPDGDIFFGGRMCKMQSIIASLATAKFNQLMLVYNIQKNNYTINNKDVIDTTDVVDYIYESSLYQFDCKVWDVPTADDAMAWFLFRNIDCIRNGKQQTAQTYLSHKELMGKHTDDQIQLLKDNCGIDWNQFNEGEKYGRLVVKRDVECTREENGKTITFTRSKWFADNGMDLTIKENRDLFIKIWE